jgi:hypothetical protein
LLSLDSREGERERQASTAFAFSVITIAYVIFPSFRSDLLFLFNLKQPKKDMVNINMYG